MKSRQLLVVFSAITLGSLESGAQERNGRIEGRVTRSDGRGAPGITVVVTEISATDLTDGNGNYVLSDLAEGTYTLVFFLGENQASEFGVHVDPDTTTRVDKSFDWDGGFVSSISVMSASRKKERIVDAPAAMTYVSETEIAQEASHAQLPKVLEFTPGAEVTQGGLYDFNFNTRGFNSSLNRRVAVLIDGRDASVPLLGAQEWAAVPFPLDEIASLEFLRGPSAALYGANASSGVINLHTKQPRYSPGGKLRFTGGELDTINIDFRWAGELRKDWYIKTLGGLRTSADFAVSRMGAAEYSVPCPPSQSGDCLPQEAVPIDREAVNIYFGGVRADKYLRGGTFLTFEGGFSNIRGPLVQTGGGRVQVLDVRRPWVRFNATSDRWNLLAYYNRRDTRDQLAMATGTKAPFDSYNVQFEGQHNWTLDEDRIRLVTGGSYRREKVDSFDDRQGRQTLLRDAISAHFGAVFGQLDWNVTEKLRLVLAGRVDDSTLHDSQFSPKGSIVYTLSPNNTIRFTYNEAFQVANYTELFLKTPVAQPIDLSRIEAAVCSPFGVACGFDRPTQVLALGNSELDVEKVRTYEVGYNGLWQNRLYFSAVYYRSENRNFITDVLPMVDPQGNRINPTFGPYVPPLEHPAPELLAGALEANLPPSLFATLSNDLDNTPIFATLSYRNFGRVDTRGVEIGLNYYLPRSVTALLSYSWFDFELHDPNSPLSNQVLPNAPRNQFSVGLSFSSLKWDGRIGVRWTEGFRWAVGLFQGDVPAYSVTDLAVNYKIFPKWAIGLNIANLFDNDHWESFGGDLLGRRSLANVLFSF